MNLVQVGTSSILVFSIRAIPLSWLLEATRYICLSYGDDISCLSSDCFYLPWK